MIHLGTGAVFLFLARLVKINVSIKIKIACH